MVVMSENLAIWKLIYQRLPLTFLGYLFLLHLVFCFRVSEYVYMQGQLYQIRPLELGYIFSLTVSIFWLVLILYLNSRVNYHIRIKYLTPHACGCRLGNYNEAKSFRFCYNFLANYNFGCFIFFYCWLWAAG